jgi:hypothetical protein
LLIFAAAIAGVDKRNYLFTGNPVQRFYDYQPKALNRFVNCRRTKYAYQGLRP